MGRHSSLPSSCRRPVCISSAASIGTPCHPFAYADIVLTGPSQGRWEYAQKCAVCHGPGGVESNRDLSTYDHVHTLRSSVLDQVHACAMPPADGEALTAAERATLLGWLVCGAPES